MTTCADLNAPYSRAELKRVPNSQSGGEDVNEWSQRPWYGFWLQVFTVEMCAFFFWCMIFYDDLIEKVWYGFWLQVFRDVFFLYIYFMMIWSSSLIETVLNFLFITNNDVTIVSTWAVTSSPWLLAVYRGLIKLPNLMWIIINHYKDPY